MFSTSSFKKASNHVKMQMCWKREKRCLVHNVFRLSIALLQVIISDVWVVWIVSPNSRNAERITSSTQVVSVAYDFLAVWISHDIVILDYLELLCLRDSEVRAD